MVSFTLRPTFLRGSRLAAALLVLGPLLAGPVAMAQDGRQYDRQEDQSRRDGRDRDGRGWDDRDRGDRHRRDWHDRDRDRHDRWDRRDRRDAWQARERWQAHQVWLADQRRLERLRWQRAAQRRDLRAWGYNQGWMLSVNHPARLAMLADFGRARDGQTIVWQDGRSAARYQVTPGSGFDSDQGYCREYTSRVQVGNDWQQAFGTACLQPDGSWRIID